MLSNAELLCRKKGGVHFLGKTRVVQVRVSHRTIALKATSAPVETADGCVFLLPIADVTARENERSNITEFRAAQVTLSNSWRSDKDRCTGWQ